MRVIFEDLNTKKKIIIYNVISFSNDHDYYNVFIKDPYCNLIREIYNKSKYCFIIAEDTDNLQI